jgi:hypothetical protein
MENLDKSMENCDQKILIEGKELGGLLNETLNNLLAPVAEIEILKRREYLTDKEVSILFPISPGALRVERSRGRGPSYIKDGKRVLYSKRELIAYFERRMVQTYDDHK